MFLTWVREAAFGMLNWYRASSMDVPPPENLEGMDKVVSDLTIVKVPDCGHFVPWEAPELVNAALDAFLARTGG